jgi:hypothetical protein
VPQQDRIDHRGLLAACPTWKAPATQERCICLSLICLSVRNLEPTALLFGRDAGLKFGPLHQTLLARRADLLSNYLSQHLIDPVLPARSGFLKVIKNIPVNSQRDKLLGIRDSRRFRREFRGLRGCRLERRFSRIA